MPTHDDNEDEFGFAPVKVSAKDRIREIRPSLPSGLPANLERIDAVAETAGFVSREAPESRAYGLDRDRRIEPRTALNMRVPTRLGTAFQRFCAENRYSYPEGLEEIMRRAGLPLR